VRFGAADIEVFRAQGYLIVRELFGRVAISEILEAFERLEARAHQLEGPTTVNDTLFMVEPQAAGVRIERIVWCGGIEPALGTHGRSPELLELAATLLGADELDQLINQAHIKNPGDSTEFAWHQDSYHRRYGTELWTDLDGRGSFVQTLTAVDAMNAENGGLVVVPESHLQGHLPTDTGKLAATSLDLRRAVALELAPGDAVVLSPFTIHGSSPNQSRTKRRVFINGFALPGANRRMYPGAGVGFRVQRVGRAA
jgi:ectoine hydroxylase-related dioxygenase (phytanoyl-CoA dioxygenase family)